MSARPELVSLVNQGWPVASTCVAVVKLRHRRGFAVGVQAKMRSGGTGRVWPTLPGARRRAAHLAQVYRLPIVEAI